MPTIHANVFQNILRLEEHKGFNGPAVAGGLEAFARRWAEQVGTADRSAKAVAQASTGALNSYSFAGPAARREAVHKAAGLLRSYERENGARDVQGNGRSSPARGGGDNGFIPTHIEGFSGYDDVDPRAKP